MNKDQRYRAKKRRLALEILGNKCVHCGFDDPRALQIDHINGKGILENRSIGPLGIVKKVLSGDIKNYQLLCANCNWIKRAILKEYGN